MKDITIDNQQVRPFSIGYLIGIIDGEGSCCFGYKYVHNGNHVYTPSIRIYNNNPYIIQEVINALKFFDIPYWVYAPKKHGIEKRVCYRIEINGIKRVKRLTDLLIQYPSGKYKRFELLNNFCIYCLENPQSKDEQKYKILADFRSKLQQMNFEYRGMETSETIRFT